MLICMTGVVILLLLMMERLLSLEKELIMSLQLTQLMEVLFGSTGYPIVLILLKVQKLLLVVMVQYILLIRIMIISDICVL